MLESRVTFGHRTFVLNEHFNTDGTIDKTKVKDTIVVDQFIREPAYRDSREALHLAQGGTLGRVHKGLDFYRMQGRILVPDASQGARLADRDRDLRAAFDPYLCMVDNSASDGAYALDWDELTGDTTNFPSGRRPVRVYARPSLAPRSVERVADGPRRDFSLGFVCPDPRVYRQVESTITLTPASATQNVVNIGTTPAPLKLSITMAGAGNAAFTLTAGPFALVLNLSGMVNLDVVDVYMETCGPYGRGKRVTKNGVDNFALKTSGPTTWLNAPVGTTSFVMTNHTNVTSCVVAWRSAWA